MHQRSCRLRIGVKKKYNLTDVGEVAAGKPILQGSGHFLKVWKSSLIKTLQAGLKALGQGCHKCSGLSCVTDLAETR